MRLVESRVAFIHGHVQPLPGSPRMLRYLRTGGKYTKLIWWILTVVTVVTFVFMFNAFGFMGSSGPQQSGVAGTVDGSAISSQEYQQALVSQREAFKRQTGSEPT